MMTLRLLGLAADVFSEQISETAFGSFPETIVMIRFFTHHKSSTAVTTVEPLRRRGGTAVCAIEMNARSHLHEGSALGELCWFFVLHSHQCRSLIILQYPYGTDRHPIAGFGLPDGPPFPGGTYKSDNENRRDRNREDEEGFFQCKFPKHQFAALLWSISPFLSIGLQTRRSVTP
jgi:hypothetical protein